MYQACIFDLDGTLADTLASIGGFANQALNALGYPAIPIEEYRLLVGNGADMLMRGMLRRTAGSYTEEDVQRLRRVYDDLYEADPVRDVQNYPGMPELVAALRRGSFRRQCFPISRTMWFVQLQKRCSPQELSALLWPA